jgi:hypothetical protein
MHIIRSMIDYHACGSLGRFVNIVEYPCVATGKTSHSIQPYK